MVQKKEFQSYLQRKPMGASSSTKKPELRMRVFAGPNGSGKSTIIKALREYRSQNSPLDFGIYINADDIADALRKGRFSFTPYEVTTTRNEFKTIALASGLVI